MKIILDPIKGIKEIELEQMKLVLHDLVERLSIELVIDRLEAIFIPNDFGEGVTSFQKKHGLEIGYTNNEMGVAGGKTITYEEKGEQKDVIFIQLVLFLNLFDKEKSKLPTNFIHHELCHVHDNSKIEAMKTFIREYKEDHESRLLNIVKHHSMTIWGEYIAPRLSAKTIPIEDGLYILHLLELIDFTEKNIEKRINKYRFHGDVGLLFNEVQELSNPMLKIAATVIGNIDGLGINDLKVISEIDGLISETILGPNWKDIKDALRNLYENYPKWENLSVFDNLNELVLDTWRSMGIYPEDRGSQIYINVPF